MSSKVNKSGYYKLFVVCVILSVIAIGMLFATIWLSSGDDTERYLWTAAIIGIPSVIGGFLAFDEEWD